MAAVHHFINNESISSKNSYVVKSAADDSEIHAVHAADEDLIEQALSAAAAALPAWRDTTTQARRKIFLEAARLMEERGSKFMEIMERETPCATGFGQFNLYGAIEIFRELAGAVAAATRGEIIPMEDGTSESLLYRVPYGVCLAMAPWNAALILPCRSFATPIIAGNTVVFKTSELSPGTHAMFGQLMKDAGLPDGVLNIVNIDAKDAPSFAERLISDRRVRHVNFTGSTRVGSILGALAGKYIKPIVLELGGKASAVVLEDADIDVAVSQVVLGAWMHQGQICMSTERAVVHAAVYDDFLRRIKATVSESGIRSSPLGQATTAGAIRAQELVEEAIAQGAVPVLGDHGPRRGNYVPPCILADVTASMRIYYEETFAPVLVLIKAASEAEAIEIANDTEYGLSSAVFSRDVARAVRVAQKLETGATQVNGMTVADHASVPHGGTKSSGFGRFNGAEGIRTFTQTKVISVRGQGQVVPL